MLKGFKEFLLRGNIVDLAIAVVIGTAFIALVSAFTTYFINPIIASAGAADSFGFGFTIRDGNPATFVDIGSFITAIITFAITAAVVYFFVVVPMQKIMEGRSTPTEEVAESVDENTVLLREIRDVLAAQRGGTTPPTAPPTSPPAV